MAGAQQMLIVLVATFQDFLRSYKTTDADLEDLTLDGDGTSDEYDFMDDVDDGNTRNRRHHRHPKVKYMEQLRQVSDRQKDHITIELDDLQAVCADKRWPHFPANEYSMRKH